MAEDLLSYLIGYTPKWVKPESDQEMLERVYASLKPGGEEEEENEVTFDEFLKQIQSELPSMTRDQLLKLSKGGETETKGGEEETRALPSLTKAMKQQQKTKAPRVGTSAETREDFREALEKNLQVLLEIEEEELPEWARNIINDFPAGRRDAVLKLLKDYTIDDAMRVLEPMKGQEPDQPKEKIGGALAMGRPKEPEEEPEEDPSAGVEATMAAVKELDGRRVRYTGSIEKHRGKTGTAQAEVGMYPMRLEITFEDDGGEIFNVRPTSVEGIDDEPMPDEEAGRRAEPAGEGATTGDLDETVASTVEVMTQVYQGMLAFVKGEGRVADLKNAIDSASPVIEKMSSLSSKLKEPYEGAVTEEKRTVDPDLANKLKRWATIVLQGASTASGEMSSFPQLIKLLKSATREYQEDASKTTAFKVWEAAGELASQTEQLKKLADELAAISPNARLGKPLKLQPKRRTAKINKFEEIWNNILASRTDKDIETGKNIFRRYREQGRPIKPAQLATDLDVDEGAATEFLQELISKATPMESMRRRLLIKIEPLKTNRSFSEAMKEYDGDLVEDSLVATKAIQGLIGLVESCRQQLRATR